jgi:hypothetical protein
VPIKLTGRTHLATVCAAVQRSLRSAGPRLRLGRFTRRGELCAFTPRTLDTPLVVAEAIVNAINAAPSLDAVELLGALCDQGEQSLRGRSAPVRIWTWLKPL